MMIISPFGQVRLLAPSQMIIIINPFGQVRLLAPSQGCEMYADDDVNKPVWPTWAVGDLFRSARRIHINHVYPII
jgi:hypothetical protein